MNNTVSVNYQGKKLSFPYRIYNRVPPDFLIDLFPASIRGKIYARYTRHYSGYIREKFIVKLMKQSPELSVPYAIQLASEYVYEIVSVVYANFNLFDRELLDDYIKNNQDYLNKSNSRMISYWNCYYRHKYPSLKSYDGFKLFRKIKKYTHSTF